MTQKSHSPDCTPLKILHIAFTMHARGTETWLMNILRRIDKSRFQLDFLTIEGEVGLYDPEIINLGGNIQACPHPDYKPAFIKGLQKILIEKGPYDIVHAHPYTLSGLILAEAAKLKVPVRIAHSHTDRRKVMRDKSFLRRIYTAAMKKLINKYATYGLAASEQAAVSLYGKNWQNDPRWHVIYCGIDLQPYKNLITKIDARKRLGIPEKARVIGHVGSFHFEKNHEFLIDLFIRYAQKDLGAHLLLIGDGPLKSRLEDKIKTHNLLGRVTMTGIRQDIPFLLPAMDIFAFPSLFEGLGLAVVEAQAAGLHCLLSTEVPRDACIIDNAVTYLPIENSQDIWIKALQEKFKEPALDPESSYNQVYASAFNIDHNVKILTGLYETLSAPQDY